jgi:hypothetical protein
LRIGGVFVSVELVQVSLERGCTDGFTPVWLTLAFERIVVESGCLESQPKVGGKLHLKLNTTKRPIANKYREGKLKSTLKRECKRT